MYFRYFYDTFYFYDTLVLRTELRMVPPNITGGQTVVLLSDTLRQLEPGQVTQGLSDVVPLKLSPPGISNQDLGAVGSDAAVQPALEAVGERLVVEHVTQQGQVEASGLRTDNVFGHRNRWLYLVQLRVYVGHDSCNWNTKKINLLLVWINT